MILSTKKCFLAVLVLALAACGSVDSKPVKINQVQDNDIKVFFTPGLGCENNIIERINQSNKIDITVYSITNPQITNAIYYCCIQSWC